MNDESDSEGNDFSGLCLEGLRKTTENLRVADVQAEI
jgi:hypothetical protein